jgi:hypothetical protein
VKEEVCQLDASLCYLMRSFSKEMKKEEKEK